VALDELDWQETARCYQLELDIVSITFTRFIYFLSSSALDNCHFMLIDGIDSPQKCVEYAKQQTNQGKFPTQNFSRDSRE
jgi:hypothetical protein